MQKLSIGMKIKVINKQMISGYTNIICSFMSEFYQYIIMILFAKIFWFTVSEKIKEYFSIHQLLVFKDKGIISGQRHVEGNSCFGKLESTIYKHLRSPHLDVLRLSNDPNECSTDIVMSCLYVIRSKKTMKKIQIFKGTSW